jgi:hypothetical protein
LVANEDRERGAQLHHLLGVRCSLSSRDQTWCRKRSTGRVR